MSYSPFDRNPSGIVFFTNGGTEPVFDSDSNFILATGSPGYIKAPNLRVADNGNIGSVSDPDAIAIASNGNVTFSQDVSIAGDLIVNGTLTSVNSTEVTIEDPILTLGGSGIPTVDDNKDRGIAFKYFSGSAKTGFFGFDDSSGKFTFIPDATITNEVVSGSTGTIVAALEGNATTATNLQTARNFSVTGNMTASAVSFNGGANVVLTGVLHPTAISDRTAITSVDATNDFLLIWDATDSQLKKINRTNFVSGLGAMSSFTISDGTNTDTISDGNTLLFRNGAAINFTVSATDSVSGTLNASVAGDGLTMINQVLAVGAGTLIDVTADAVNVDLSEANEAAIANGDYILFLDGGATGTAAKESLADLATLFAGNGLTASNSVLAVNTGTGLEISSDTVRIATSAAGNGLTGGGGSALSVVAGTGLSVNVNGVHIDLSEYGTPVAFASGDSFLVLDSDGATEQLGTISQLGSYLAGTNVIAGGDGKLSVTDATVEGVVFTSANFVDSASIDFAVTAGESVTATVKNDSIGNTQLRNSVAYSVIGRSGSTSGDPADIAAASDHQVLRRSGTTLGFGAINLASTNAVTGDLPYSNLAQGSALSVLGVTGNATADVASITAGTDGFVLRRSGTTLGFGTVATEGISNGAVTEAKRLRTVDKPSSSKTVDKDIIFADAATGAVTLTLPSAASNSGRILYIKKVDSSTNIVTISSTDTIDGAASKVLYSQYESITVVSDATTWNII